MTEYTTITLELEPELLAWLEEESKRSSRTKDEIVEQAIRQYMEAYEHDREISNDRKG